MNLITERELRKLRQLARSAGAKQDLHAVQYGIVEYVLEGAVVLKVARSTGRKWLVVVSEIPAP